MEKKYYVTKRWLGIGLTLAGVLGILIAFANDLLGRSDFQGIGPRQLMVIILATILLLVGLSLIPLGAKPA
ncbi:MAG: hypothetical protein AAGD96_16445 [Chloroflexota bacterium]